MKLSGNFRSALYWFVEDLTKGLFDHESWDFDYETVFENNDGTWEKYQGLLADPGIMKSVFSIWSNNIEIDKDGNVLNEDYAQLRAFQYLRTCFDPGYSKDKIEPPLEPWEFIEFEFEDSDK
jgi:hypothetical protein